MSKKLTKEHRNIIFNDLRNALSKQYISNEEINTAIDDSKGDCVLAFDACMKLGEAAILKQLSELVIAQSGVGEDEARETLTECQGNVVKTLIMIRDKRRSKAPAEAALSQRIAAIPAEDALSQCIAAMSVMSVDKRWNEAPAQAETAAAKENEAPAQAETAAAKENKAQATEAQAAEE